MVGIEVTCCCDVIDGHPLANLVVFVKHLGSDEVDTGCIHINEALLWIPFVIGHDACLSEQRIEQLVTAYLGQELEVALSHITAIPLGGSIRTTHGRLIRVKFL